MRNRMMVMIVAIVITTVAACSEKQPREVRIENIMRIFMHERGRYTFLVRQADGVTLMPVTFTHLGSQGCERASSPGERFVMDVPEGQLAWATWGTWYGGMGSMCRRDAPLTIHLHSASQVLAAGWDHGKFGSGTTNVIE